MVAERITQARVATRDRECRRVERAMGTMISLYVPDGGAGSPAVDAAFTWFHEVDDRFSPFRADSEVSQLMRGELHAAVVSDDLAEVLGIAEAVEVLSGGAFDIRRHRPDGRPDPTGVVKGWSVDRAGVILADAGFDRFSISAGGDVLVRGGQQPDLHWRVGVAHPYTPEAVALVLQGSDLAVATSGTTERGHHINDGRTGAVADELLSVTVVGPELARADAYATAAFAMGVDGLRWVEALPGYAAAGITHDARLISTRDLDRFRDRRTHPGNQKTRGALAPRVVSSSLPTEQVVPRLAPRPP